MMEGWVSPIVELPPQGMKVMCFLEGDIWIGYRFGENWIHLPFRQGTGIITPAPKLWKHVFPPPPYTGKILFHHQEKEDELLYFDELQENYPEDCEELIEKLIENCTKWEKK